MNPVIDFKLFQQGVKRLAGIDEAGRGALAGPVVVSAVVLDLEKLFGAKHTEEMAAETWAERLRNNDVWAQVEDSKKINAKKRSYLEKLIKDEALFYSIEVVQNNFIDNYGISQAGAVGFNKVIEKLRGTFDHVATDFFKVSNLDQNIQTNTAKGDQLSVCIAAASILAKVARDDIMADLGRIYTDFRFEKHKGYGTKEHLQELQKWGATPIHRKTFAPVARAISNNMPRVNS